MTPSDEGPIAGKRVFAFAGIGRPEKFYATLRQIGCTVAATRDFPDHHKFSDREIKQGVNDASAYDATPGTTEKDFVRLPDQVRSEIKMLRVDLEWADPGSPDQILEDIAKFSVSND